MFNGLDCGDLTDPANGDVDTSSGTGYLDVAAYTCIKGYELIGNDVRTCEADGNWSDSAPVCIVYGKETLALIILCRHEFVLNLNSL